MRSSFAVFALALVALLTSVSINGQTAENSPAGTKTGDSAVSQNRVIGEVTALDPAANRVTIKTDTGSIITVLLDEKTTYLLVPPGEKDLKKAAKIALSDIKVGDRAYARGRLSEDQKSIPALALIIMSRADIAKKQDRDRAEWIRRGIVGVVTALNAETKEISLTMRSREGSKEVVIEAAGNVRFRRYAPDSVKFSDAKMSSFAELKVGDQLRALGEKNGDGTRFTPEEIVSGSFRTVAGSVIAVDPATQEVKIADLQGKQQLTIHINQDSILRRLPPMFAARMAQRRQEGATREDGPPPQNMRPPQNMPERRAEAGDGQAPMRSRMGMGGGMDFQEMLDRLPVLELGELKQGDIVIVSSTVGNDPSNITAIRLIAGLDPLFSSTKERAVPMGGMWDLGIGLP